MKLKSVLVAAAIVLASPIASDGARADLIGDVISAEYDFTTFGQVWCTACFTPQVFTVGAGLESTTVGGFGVAVFSIDFSADALTITYLSTADWTVAPFNGVVFTVLSGSPFSAISSVLGISALDVTEPADRLAINWEGITFNTGDQVVVNFAPVPGPIIGAGLPGLVAACGALIALVRRRRRLRMAG